MAESATNPTCGHHNRGFFNKIDVKWTLRTRQGRLRYRRLRQNLGPIGSDPSFPVPPRLRKLLTRREAL
jgi:hypothetical protein